MFRLISVNSYRFYNALPSGKLGKAFLLKRTLYFKLKYKEICSVEHRFTIDTYGMLFDYIFPIFGLSLIFFDIRNNYGYQK